MKSCSYSCLVKHWRYDSLLLLPKIESSTFFPPPLARISRLRVDRVYPADYQAIRRTAIIEQKKGPRTPFRIGIRDEGDPHNVKSWKDFLTGDSLPIITQKKWHDPLGANGVAQYAFVDDCLLAHICDAGFSDAARD